MGAFTSMIVLIVLIATIGKVMNNRYRAMARVQDRTVAGALDGAEAARLRDDVQRLRERVAVLERVVTDTHGATSLDREIGRLRDR